MDRKKIADLDRWKKYEGELQRKDDEKDRTLITSTMIDAAERDVEQLNCEDPAGDA